MSIKVLLKQNVALVVGLTFPVLLIIIFLFATVIPKALGNPPQYELLYVTSRYDYQTANDPTFDFFIKDNQLKVKARKSDDKNTDRLLKKLMIYDGKSQTVKEIHIDWSKVGRGADASEVPLEETKFLQVDSSDISPDGYVLDGPNYNHTGFLGGMFGGSDRGAGYRIKKGNVAYKLPVNQTDYYEQLQFVGWVIKK